MNTAKNASAFNAFTLRPPPDPSLPILPYYRVTAEADPRVVYGPFRAVPPTGRSPRGPTATADNSTMPPWLWQNPSLSLKYRLIAVILSR